MSKKDRNRSRWNTHPLRLALSIAPWEKYHGSSDVLEKKIKATRKPPDDILANGFSCVLSYMAANGILNLREGMAGYMEFCYRHYQAKLRRSGKIIEDWARDTVRAKVQQYGTMDDLGQPSEAEIAEQAREYRNRKNGIES